jgi:hypothetical protein
VSARRLVSAIAFGAALALGGAARVEAGTIYLLNGQEIDGEIIGVNAEEVTIKYGFGSMRINLREVRDIELRPGESVWEKEIRNALENSRRLAQEEFKRRLAQRPASAAQPGASPAQSSPGPERVVPSDRTAGARPSSTVPSARKFAGRVFETEAWGLRFNYPVGWEAKEAANNFFTFRDGRDAARTSWSFCVTGFDEIEIRHEALVARAERELARVSGYRVVRRNAFELDGNQALRTTGIYERDGAVIRHDQVIVRARRGTIIFDIFSPGAPLDRNGVPEVEGVLSTVEVR